MEITKKIEEDLIRQVPQGRPKPLVLSLSKKSVEEGLFNWHLKVCEFYRPTVQALMLDAKNKRMISRDRAIHLADLGMPGHPLPQEFFEGLEVYNTLVKSEARAPGYNEPSGAIIARHMYAKFFTDVSQLSTLP